MLMMSLLPTGAIAASDGYIAAELQPLVENHELAGAVALVASKDKVLSLDAVGYADIAAKMPMKSDNLFWIASMSKPIAATALMMLVEEGKIRLNEPARTYLPNFAPRIMASDGAHVILEPPHQPITVRSLLSHTGGVAFRTSLETPTLDTFPLAVRVESYSLEPLLYEPGTAWEYSNAGFNTAARIVEVVSGMSYERFLQERLFEPLGMRDTTFWPTEAQLKHLAKAYKLTENGKNLEETVINQLRYPLSDRSHRYSMPAGGLFSTATDLLKYCQMLLNNGTYGGHRYLTEASIREMTTNQVPQVVHMGEKPYPETEGYGLGWFTSPSGAFGHQGAFWTSMRIDPEKGLIEIWLVQHDGFPDGAKAFQAFQNAVDKHFASMRTAGFATH